MVIELLIQICVALTLLCLAVHQEYVTPTPPPAQNVGCAFEDCVLECVF